MNWFVLLLLSILFASFAVLMQRIVMKGENNEPISYGVLYQAITGCIIAGVGFAIHDTAIPKIQPLLPNLIATTLLYGFGNIFIFKALKAIEASEFTVIYTGRVLVTVIISSVLLHEILGPQQIMGGVCIIAGILLVTSNFKKFSLSKGEMYAALTALFFGAAPVNDRILLKSFTIYPYVSLAYFLPALFTGLLYWRKLNNLKHLIEVKKLIKLFMLCILYALGSITFFRALQLTPNTSELAVINQSQTIVTVLLAAVLLKENKRILKKVTAAVITFIGVLLVK